MPRCSRPNVVEAFSCEYNLISPCLSCPTAHHFDSKPVLVKVTYKSVEHCQNTVGHGPLRQIGLAHIRGVAIPK
eukprot:5644621-Amphidinium_carterae.2